MTDDILKAFLAGVAYHESKSMWAGDGAAMAAAEEYLDANPSKSDACFNAVISYVLANPCESPMEFLRCWNYGDFDSIRREWPDAPSDVFLADPLHKESESDD